MTLHGPGYAKCSVDGPAMGLLQSIWSLHHITARCTAARVRKLVLLASA